MTEMDRVLALPQAGLLDAYMARMEGVGALVTLQDGRSGRLDGVDASGGLILDTESGRIVVHSGDVSLRPPASP